MIPILGSDFLILAKKCLKETSPEASITLLLTVLGSQSVLGNTYISTTVYPHTLKTPLTLFLLQNKIKIPTFWKGTSVLLRKLKNFPEEKFNPEVLKLHQGKTKSWMDLLTHIQHLEMWSNGCQAQMDEVLLQWTHQPGKGRTRKFVCLQYD